MLEKSGNFVSPEKWEPCGGGGLSVRKSGNHVGGVVCEECAWQGACMAEGCAWRGGGHVWQRGHALQGGHAWQEGMCVGGRAWHGE